LVAIDINAILAEIADINRDWNHINHPVHQALLTGKLSKAQFREFIAQYSCIPLYNHKHHGPIYVNCPSHKWRARLAEVVYEEGSGNLYADGVSHHELYLRLCEAAGISRDAIYDWPLCPEVVAYMAHAWGVSARSFLEGATRSMLVGEAQVPGYAAKMAAAFQRHYGLTAEQSVFWTVHEVADDEHSDVGRELLADFVHTEAERELVLRTARQSAEIQWMMLDGIESRLATIK
jgi:pyrroloquinoline quinone (PQQ) biosynthesis protein C